MNLELPFSGGLDLPLYLPELSEMESISVYLKSPFSGGVDLPLDLPPGLPELKFIEEESISMNLKLPFPWAGTFATWSARYQLSQ